MILLALALPLAVWPLKSDDGGFVSGGATGQWAWGVPTTGPADAGKVWGTNLQGLYLNDAVDTLEIPMPSLQEAAAPVLVMTHWYRTRPGDVGYLEVDDGTGWQVVEPVYGYPFAGGFSGDSGGWVDSAWHLDGFGPSPAVRLVFHSDVSGASEGWYVGSAGVYDGDAVPPRITPVTVPEDTQDLDGPYVVRLDIEDDHGLIDTWIDTDAGPVPLVDVGGAYEAALPAVPPDTVVSWRAVADDGEQVTTWPEDGDAAFRVFLAAPTGLSAPDGRLIGTSVPLSWSPPVSPHPVVGYQVAEEGVHTDPIEVTVPEAEVPATPEGTWTWTVRALYDVGSVVQGDPTEPLSVDVEVPIVDTLAPDAGYPGERLWVEVSGESLYLVTGRTEVDLGEGIAVEDVEVLDVGRVLARIAIDADATAGARDLQIIGPRGTFAFARAFTVRAGDGAPAVVQVSPSHVDQGEAATVSVVASQPFAGPVQVEPGPGLLVTSDVVTDGDTARFDLVALGDAGPGVHTILLDDGERLWAAPIEVREKITPLDQGCVTAPASAWWAWILLPALFRRRRT